MSGLWNRVSGNFTAEPLCSLHRTDDPPKGRNSCLRLRPRSVFGSFGVVLMSCKFSRITISFAEFNVSFWKWAFIRSFTERVVRVFSLVVSGK